MELHDELGQYITAIKSIAQSIANRTKESDHKTHTSSNAIVSASGQIYDALHNIIKKLRPLALEKFGLSETLKEATEEWKKIHSVKFSIQVESLALSDEAEISLFRVAQECVNNSIKHSTASEIEIILKNDFEKKLTILSVSDNGIGIAMNSLNNPDRFGIIGMRERMQILGGELEIITETNQGTKIIATLPSGLS